MDLIRKSSLFVGYVKLFLLSKITGCDTSHFSSFGMTSCRSRTFRLRAYDYFY